MFNFLLFKFQSKDLRQTTPITSNCDDEMVLELPEVRLTFLIAFLETIMLQYRLKFLSNERNPILLS